MAHKISENNAFGPDCACNFLEDLSDTLGLIGV